MFRGTLTALITPFINGRVDTTALKRLVEMQISAGIHGLVACGTTGEAAAMTQEEKLEVVRTVVRISGGKVPVIAGAGTNNTAQTVDNVRRLADLGVDGVLVVTPYYVKPTQKGMIEHFEKVAEVGLPVVAYNVPGRTGVSLSAETAAALSNIPRVVGLKEASGDMRLAADIARRIGGEFSLLSGDDFTYLPFLSVGGVGCISVASNLLPGPMADIYNKFAAGDLSGARAIQHRLLPLMDALFMEPNPIPVKAAAAMLGWCAEEIRLPLTQLSENLKPRLRAALASVGLIES